MSDKGKIKKGKSKTSLTLKVSKSLHEIQMKRLEYERRTIDVALEY